MLAILPPIQLDMATALALGASVGGPIATAMKIIWSRWQADWKEILAERHATLEEYKRHNEKFIEIVEKAAAAMTKVAELVEVIPKFEVNEKPAAT